MLDDGIARSSILYIIIIVKRFVYMQWEIPARDGTTLAPESAEIRRKQRCRTCSALEGGLIARECAAAASPTWSRATTGVPIRRTSLACASIAGLTGLALCCTSSTLVMEVVLAGNRGLDNHHQARAYSRMQTFLQITATCAGQQE